jgi:predicted aldo/keto reductase-like oxidoreductase
MKVAGQERLVGSGEGKAGMRDLLRYALTLPVATCVIGMPRPEHLAENLQIAKGFAPLGETEMQRIRTQVAPQAAAFDRFLCGHRDDMSA